MLPRLVMVFLTLAMIWGGGVWWRLDAQRERRAIPRPPVEEAADIVYRRSKGPVDQVLRRHPKPGSPAARVELAALLARFPDSDYLSYQLGRVWLQSPGPDASSGLAVLDPVWARIENRQPVRPVWLAAEVALEVGYGRLLAGADLEADVAFGAAVRLAGADPEQMARLAREEVERRATATFLRRSSLGSEKSLAELLALRNRAPENPVVWEMLAMVSLENPSAPERLAREALPYLRDEDTRREVERRLASRPTS